MEHTKSSVKDRDSMPDIRRTLFCKKDNKGVSVDKQHAFHKLRHFYICKSIESNFDHYILIEKK